MKRKTFPSTSNEEGTEAENSKIIGHLQSEVHTLNTLVSKLFEKLDGFIAESSPKPLTLPTILGGIATVGTILAFLVGGVIWISTSSQAPIITQLDLVNKNMQVMMTGFATHGSEIQLTNQKISGIEGKVDSSNEVLNYFQYEYNVVQKDSDLTGRVKTLEMQVERIVNEAHIRKQ